MVDVIQAKHLMSRDFIRIQTDSTLREAIQTVLDPKTSLNGLQTLVVQDESGNYAGLLTPHFIFRALVSVWMPGRDIVKDKVRMEIEFMRVVEDRLDLRVSDAMARGLPTASPTDRIPHLIELTCESRLECVPVTENGQVLGIVYLVDIFKAAADLALTSENQGITLK